MANPISPKAFRVLLTKLVDGMVPASLRHARSSHGLARVFVGTHLVGAVACSAVVAYLGINVSANDLGFYFLTGVSVVLFALPLILKRTGNMSLVTFASFQTLTTASLVGTFEYGGFASPFLPWLMVALMSGLFYQSRNTAYILGLFLGNLAIFFGFLIWRAQPALPNAVDLTLLSWVSISVAMSYMAYMALYYARVIASRAELEAEAGRYHAIAIELEQARMAAMDLNHTRSQFFSKMSHELRTPLNAIIGYSEILLEDIEDTPKPNDQHMADLTRINSTGRHLLSLVAEVLDVDTVENGDSTIDISTFSLGELCKDVAATVKPAIEENGNQLVIDCAQPEDEISNDSKKLRQMLINLASNAGKFTKNGTVTLEVWIERTTADDRLHLAVLDTGIGIDADALPKLFETYVQADQTIHSRFGGTGIGLALTRKFSGLLGGTVSVESKLGKGSCFTIDIPANAKVATASVAAADAPKFVQENTL